MHVRVFAHARTTLTLSATRRLGGTLKSKYQSLTSGCLLATFVSVWSLASSVRIMNVSGKNLVNRSSVHLLKHVEHEFRSMQITATPFLGLLYSVLFAAGISTVVSLCVFPKAANKNLAAKLIDTMGTASELLLASMHLFQNDRKWSGQHPTYQELSTSVLALRQQLSHQVKELRPSYDEARFEIIWSYFPIHRYQPYIDTCLKLQSLLCSRMGLDPEVSPYQEEVEDGHDPRLPHPLRRVVDELAELNLRLIDRTRRDLARSSRLGCTISPLVTRRDENLDIERWRDRIQATVKQLRTSIAEALDFAMLDYRDQGQEGSKSSIFHSTVSWHGTT